MTSRDVAVVSSSLAFKQPGADQYGPQDNININLLSKELIHEYGYTQVWKAELSRDVFRKITEGGLIEGPEDIDDRESATTSATGEKPTVVCVIKQFTPRVKRLRSPLEKTFARDLSNLRAVPKHPRIIPLIGSYSSKQQTIRGDSLDNWNLVFPYAEEGDLHTLLRERSPPTWLVKSAGNEGKSVIEIIVTECLGLAEALTFIHNKDNVVFIIHRDIKPSNILIQDGKFILADFGIFCIKQSEETSRTDWLSDTPLYRAPERETQDDSGRPRDIWALGCVFMELAVLIVYGWFSNFDEAERAKHPEPAIETFEEWCRAASGDRGTAAYWLTMAVVGEWYRYMSSCYRTLLHEASNLDPMALLLSVIPAALAQDPKNRATAEDIAECLRGPGDRPTKLFWAGDPVLMGAT